MGRDRNRRNCQKLYHSGNASGRKKTIEVPQNYRLEIEEFGRCIAENEMPVVTEEFSVKNARLVDRILKEIGY